jgi:hypothetical protein
LVKARGENKIPVIGLRKTDFPGALLVIHQDDFEEIYKEWQRARGFHVYLQPLTVQSDPLFDPQPKHVRTILSFQGEEHELRPVHPPKKRPPTPKRK